MSESEHEPKYTRQSVISIRTWQVNKLFSLSVTREPGFIFEPGQFARIGLPETEDADNVLNDGVPNIWRAYSMVSAPHESHLEFYSIIVPGGQFTSRLGQLKSGDTLFVEKVSYGFLTLERFAPGETLWLIASGTGLSAYMSMLRSRQAWQSYRHIILVHGVRYENELGYREEIEGWVRDLKRVNASLNKACSFTYLPIATRQTLAQMPQARLTTLIADGRLEQLAGESLNPIHARVMLCGNPDLLMDARKLLAERGFAAGRRGVKGNLALENYW